jgi:hypothetical protein
MIKLKKPLPKWPAFVVKGKKVTREQAMEIIIRTDSLHFSTNDHEFAKQLFEATYGLKAKKGMCHISLYDFFRKENSTFEFQKMQDLENTVKLELGNISNALSYIDNQQIVSAWVGGPHGWCSWDGYIGCNTFNIGKWPSIEEVLKEWKIVAKTFPFLELKCQLFSGEQCEEDENEPLVEYAIKNGKVRMYLPKEVLDYPKDDLDMSILRMTSPYGERGCDILKVKNALQFTKNKIKETTNK